MGKPSPPPAPDYTPMIQGAQATAASDLEAAKIQAQVAREQLAKQDIYATRAADLGDRYANMAQDQAAYGKQQYEDLKPYLNQYLQSQLDWQGAATTNEKEQAAAAAESRRQASETYSRYMTTYAPMEDKFAKEAQAYASPARMEADAAAARGDVATAFNATRDQAQRQLQSYGVDPSQGAFQGTTQAMNISRAAALAAAGTMARKQTEQQGKQYEAAAIEMGQKLPAQAIAQAGLSTNQAAQGLNGAAIGGGGLSAGSGLLTSGTTAMGSPTSYAALNPYTQLAGAYGTQGTQMFGNQISALSNASGAFNVAGNQMSNMYSGQIENYKASAATSPWAGVGQAIGMGLGAYKLFGCDIRLKDNVQPYTRGLDAVNEFDPVSFTYNSIILDDDGRIHVGVIANDIEDVVPEMVGEVNGYKMIDPMVVIFTLVNAVKELTARVKQLEGSNV